MFFVLSPHFLAEVYTYLHFRRRRILPLICCGDTAGFLPLFRLSLRTMAQDTSQSTKQFATLFREKPHRGNIWADVPGDVGASPGIQFRSPRSADLENPAIYSHLATTAL